MPKTSMLPKGPAVFLSQSPSRLAEGTRRDEVHAELKGLLARPPSQGTFDGWNGMSTWSWDGFAAESLVMLWVGEPTRPLWRDAVARMVFFPRYQTLKLLYARCAKHRASVREDFARLRRLALEWAKGERVELGAVPITNVLRTLLDCAEAHVSPELVDAAVRQARTRGLIDKDDVKVIRARARAA